MSWRFCGAVDFLGLINEYILWDGVEALRAGGGRVLAKGPLALKDYSSFPRAQADMTSARKVISLIKGVIRSQLISSHRIEKQSSTEIREFCQVSPLDFVLFEAESADPPNVAPESAKNNRAAIKSWILYYRIKLFLTDILEWLVCY